MPSPDRSELQHFAVGIAVIALSGCDVAFGLSGEPNACDLGSFDGAPVTEMMDAEDFSLTDDGFGVVVTRGLPLEISADRDPVSIDLGAYTVGQVGISPEGDLLVYSGMIEPPLLVVATRGDDGIWRADSRQPPKGVFGGTPSATAFGPRRMLVRLRDVQPAVQEYEDTGTAWKPVGEPFEVGRGGGIGLTPNGLTMVFIESGDEQQPGVSLVKAANRDSMSDPFDEPQVILTGPAHAAQMLDGKHCDQLLVSDGTQLVRYDR